MTSHEILEKLRRQYVDGYREWDEDYEGFMQKLETRLGCLSSKLFAHAGGRAVTTRGPTGDVHYYAIEVAIRARADRYKITPEEIEAAGGEAVYLVAYCSSVLPLVEFRWHSVIAEGHAVESTSFDLLDDEFLAEHPSERELSMVLIDEAAACGWQTIDPALTEQQPPSDWPWPLPTYDYRNGEYLVRDYIIKGMRDD